MSKFKVGDKVIGNEKAGKRYAVTGKGYIGTVLNVFDNMLLISASDECDSYKVNECCFDLYESKEVRDYIETDIKITSIVVDENKCEIGGEKMNKILQLYKERKEKEIKDRYDKIIEEEYNKIEFIEVYNNLVDAFEGAMKELFENEENAGCKYMKDTGISYNAYKYQLNPIEIKREIQKKYNDDYICEIKKLDDFIKEVETTLSLAEIGSGVIDQDRVIEILSNYQIIDKKTLKIKE